MDPRVEPGTGTSREKDRPIDPMSGKNSPASPSPNRFLANGQADGRQPFMPQEYLTTPAFEDLSLPFRPCEADAAALVGRLDNAFHPATDHHSRIPIICKAIAVIWLLGKDTAGAYRASAIAGFGWTRGARADRRAYLRRSGSGPIFVSLPWAEEWYGTSCASAEASDPTGMSREM